MNLSQQLRQWDEADFDGMSLAGIAADEIDKLVKQLLITQDWLDRFQSALAETNMKLIWAHRPE